MNETLRRRQREREGKEERDDKVCSVRVRVGQLSMRGRWRWAHSLEEVSPMEYGAGIPRNMLQKTTDIFVTIMDECCRKNTIFSPTRDQTIDGSSFGSNALESSISCSAFKHNSLVGSITLSDGYMCHFSEG